MSTFRVHETDTGDNELSPLQLAEAYLRRGWKPIPVPAGSKIPKLTGWPELRLSGKVTPSDVQHLDQEVTACLSPL